VLAIVVSAWISAAGTGTAAAKTTLFVKNYVNSNEIQSVVAWNGVLAMGTLGGIVTIQPTDGAITKILRTPGGGLPSNHVLAVAVSPSGLLWAGTAEAGIGRLRPDGTFRRTLSSFDGLPSDHVQAIYTHGDSVWVGTAGGAALFTENAGGLIGLARSFTAASTSGGLVSDDVRAFAQVGDTLWVGTTAGLSSFTGGAWTNRTAALSRPTTSLILHADTLWAATDLGPYQYVSGTFRPANAGHAFASQTLGVSGSTLYSGASMLGAHRYVPGTGWISVSTGLPSLRVTSLRDGPDGALWAGTAAGAARLLPATDSWEPHLSDGPLANGSERAAVDANGVWFTTGNNFPPGARGVVLHFDGASWSALTNGTTAGMLQATDAFAIFSDRDTRVWIGHCCLDGEPRPRVDRYDPATGAWATPPAFNIWAIDQAPTGIVYAAGVEHENGVYALDPASGALLDSLTPANSGITSNNLHAVRFDSAGKGWFGTAFNGIDVWDGRGTPTHGDDLWVHHDVNPSNLVSSLAVLGPETAWIGTSSGAGRIENGIFTRVLTNPALPSGQVNDLTLDSGGSIWIATSAGLARADASGLGQIEVFTFADGLVDNDIRALAWDARRGVLWVGTANGVSRVVAGAQGEPGITDSAYVYPNPSRTAGMLKLGGIQNALEGEIRDLAGNVVHRFRCDPAQNEIWDLTREDGEPAPSGVYLVVLRDRSGGLKTLRAAVVR
jgi:ligand-binding sensor domain-containing protein